MIWWIFILIAIGIGIWVGIEEYSVGLGIATGLLSVLLALLASLLCCLIVSSCYKMPDNTPTNIVDTTEIIALHDGSNIEGHISGGIFCTSGYVDEKPVYTVLTKTDKGLKTKVYEADKTYIQFTKDKPKVETVVTEATGFWNFFCGDGLLDTTGYIIYIPTNSEIVNDYVIDLE